MAKESQVLQIALIVFVILTLGLGVSTFMLYKKVEELTLKAKQDSDQAAIATKSCAAVQAYNTELLRLIGFVASEKLETVSEEFEKDMESYAGSLDATTRNYRKVLAYLNDELAKKNVTLADQQKSVQELKDKIAVLEQIKQPQIDAAVAGQKAANDDLAKRTEQFNTDRGEFVGKTAAAEDHLTKSHKEQDAALTKLAAEKKKLEDALVETEKQKKDRIEQVHKLTKTTFESPLGEIRWVNQRERTVWIDLGRANALPRQLTLAVYSGNTQNVTSAAKKGGIEISRILGDHLSEARIVDDSPSDPLLPGDVVHTPLWTPGAGEIRLHRRHGHRRRRRQPARRPAQPDHPLRRRGGGRADRQGRAERRDGLQHPLPDRRQRVDRRGKNQERLVDAPPGGQAGRADHQPQGFPPPHRVQEPRAGDALWSRPPIPISSWPSRPRAVRRAAAIPCRRFSSPASRRRRAACIKGL